MNIHILWYRFSNCLYLSQVSLQFFCLRFSLMLTSTNWLWLLMAWTPLSGETLSVAWLTEPHSSQLSLPLLSWNPTTHTKYIYIYITWDTFSPYTTTISIRAVCYNRACKGRSEHMTSTRYILAWRLITVCFYTTCQSLANDNTHLIIAAYTQWPNAHRIAGCVLGHWRRWSVGLCAEGYFRWFKYWWINLHNE